MTYDGHTLYHLTSLSSQNNIEESEISGDILILITYLPTCTKGMMVTNPNTEIDAD